MGNAGVARGHRQQLQRHHRDRGGHLPRDVHGDVLRIHLLRELILRVPPTGSGHKRVLLLDKRPGRRLGSLPTANPQLDDRGLREQLHGDLRHVQRDRGATGDGLPGRRRASTHRRVPGCWRQLHDPAEPNHGQPDLRRMGPRQLRQRRLLQDVLAQQLRLRGMRRVPRAERHRPRPVLPAPDLRLLLLDRQLVQRQPRVRLGPVRRRRPGHLHQSPDRQRKRGLRSHHHTGYPGARTR